MKRELWKIALCGVVAMGVAQVALAYRTEPMSVKADSKAGFAVVDAEVHRQMAPGKRFEFLSKDEASEVDSRMSDMRALFDKYGTVAQMDAPAKLQLFNDQQAVNAILTQRDSDRLVCQSEMPTGSLIPKTTCRTYGEIQHERMRVQNYYQNQLMQTPQTTQGH